LSESKKEIIDNEALVRNGAPLHIMTDAKSSLPKQLSY